ncbi:C4-dicarboxylate transporter DctM subunit [Desulfitobacterium sp. LBE]|uniref:TRAP transporter large permease n=1 Tax=Desulfitobacterium sp. LBE TaxID=884086 RepID=UPI00119B903C|nr:TRAP transporter large permease [Desulfitobacterium sp. LBE]TWH57313.1 C4-dicarboxylate transporter DctM subunit [Desulfitobacterium sp. LBE]
MTTGVFLVIMMIALLFIGFPVFVALAMPAALAIHLFITGVEPTIVVQRMISGVNSFTLLSLPLFVLLADIIARGVMGEKIINLTKEMVGHLKGGIAITVVLASLVFGAISGSGTASMLALGSVFLVALRQGNYDDIFSYGLISTSSSLSSLIPPGVAMILYATITGTSVQDVFLVGLSMGIVFGVILAAYGVFYAIKNKIPVTGKFNLKAFLKSLKEGFWTIIAPVLILGGIYGGFVTPTEAAALAVVYALIIEVFVYRSFKLKEIFSIAIESAKTSTMILVLISAGTIMSWVMTIAQIPQTVGQLLLNVPDSMVLLIITLVFIILGMFIDGFSAMVIMVPILFPVIQRMGMDPALFGLLIVLNTAIGTNTPPFGIHIFAGVSKFNVSYITMVRALMPFVILSLISLLIFTYMPGVALWLPNLLKFFS